MHSRKYIKDYFVVMKKVITIYGLLIFCLSGSLHAEKTEASADSVLFISGDMLGYLNNLEYYNDYREGEPFWGAYLQARLSYKPFKKFLFSGGIHMRKDFGDESFLSDIRPLFQALYTHKDFTLIFGELANKTRHGLLDAIIKEQFIYNPVVEEGIQILIKNDRITQDLWANYPALNTRKHREHLCAGNTTVLFVKPVTFSLMGYVSHYGGQLFDPGNDPVRENVTGAAGVAYTKEFGGTFEEVGAEQFFTGSYTSDTTSGANRNYDGGWGSLSHIWILFAGVEIGVSFYKGDDFTTWEGNPMYQSDASYYFLEVNKSFVFEKNIFIDIGLRLDFMDMYPADYFENGDNQIWFRIGGSFNRKIR
jgi:hypothetical protein